MKQSDWDILRKYGVTPKNLHVYGSLNLIGSDITALPDNLRVSWSLHLRNSAITELPANLNVGGSLAIIDTAITALPDSIHVGERLYLFGSKVPPLLKLPDWEYRLDRAGDRYIAGCRNFTYEQAIAHWGSDDYPCRERGDAFVAAIEAEEKRRKEAQK